MLLAHALPHNMPDLRPTVTQLVPQAPVLESDLHRGVGWDAAAVWQAKQAAIALLSVCQLWWHQKCTRTTLFDSWDVGGAQDALFPTRNDLQQDIQRQFCHQSANINLQQARQLRTHVMWSQHTKRSPRQQQSLQALIDTWHRLSGTPIEHDIGRCVQLLRILLHIKSTYLVVADCELEVA